MRSNNRLWFIFTILAVLLAFVPASLAQDGMFGLSGDDYALFTAGNAGSTMSDAMAFDFSFVLDSAEADANLTGTGVIGTDEAGGPIVQIAITGTGSEMSGDAMTESPVNVEIRVVDNMLFVNDMTGSDGWMGGSLDQALESVVGASGLPVSPEDLAAGDISGLTGGADMGAMMGAMDGIMESGFISMSRLGDENVNGVDTAHFNTNLNIASLVNSEAFGAILMASGQLEGSDEEVTQQLQFMQPMVVSMVEGIDINFDQYISTGDSNQVQRGVLAIDLNIPSLTGDAEPILVNLNLTVNITDYAPVVSVTAPESFTEAPM